MGSSNYQELISVRQRISVPFTHLKKFQGVGSDVFERWLFRFNDFLQISDEGTAFDLNVKYLVAFITLDPAKNSDLVGHIPLPRAVLYKSA